MGGGWALGPTCAFKSSVPGEARKKRLGLLGRGFKGDFVLKKLN